MTIVPNSRTLAFLTAAAIAVLTVSLRGADPAPIPLWPEGVPGLRADAGPEKDDGSGRFTNIHHPSLVPLRPTAPANGTAIIYAPGGGYVRVAAGIGGGELAKWLRGLGVTVFILKYRHADYGQPAPLQDALRAVRLVRTRAAEWAVDPARIGFLGGSAGGHVAASAATMWDAPEGRTGSELDRVSGRPDFAVLVFPVITMTEPHAHGVSRRALLGADPTPALVERWSVENRVSAGTAPVFLVHSAEDATVVVENSLLFFQAMRRAKAPIELHLYPRGPHGAGMDPKLGPTAEWPRLCESWLRFNGWLPKLPPP